MAANVVQAKYEELEQIASKFAQQAEAVTELKSIVRQRYQALVNGGWQGTGFDAFVNEMESEVFPASERLQNAFYLAQAVILQICEVFKQAEEEASAPFRGESTLLSKNDKAHGEQARGENASPSSQEDQGSGAKQALSITLDFIPGLGELKGFVEVFTGKDLVTGEKLGWWRFTGLLGLVGLNEVKYLRQAGKTGKFIKGTGAFLEGVKGGKGLGKLAGREFRVSKKHLAVVERHLARFGEHAPNQAMVTRLRTALQKDIKISGADASFYLHELMESKIVANLEKQGKSFQKAYRQAHIEALEKYDVSKFSVYHPEVIKALPEYFNSTWVNFWKNLGK